MSLLDLPKAPKVAGARVVKLLESEPPVPVWRRTHCTQGHEYTPENTYMKGIYRCCRICQREAMKRLRAARK